MFEQGRFAAGALTRGELSILTPLAGKTLDNPEMPRAVRLELPDWLLPHLDATFGDKLEDELAAMSAPAPLDLRVNILRGPRKEAQRSLACEGLHAEPTPLSPWGLRLPARLPVTTSVAFRDGLVEIQDEGSQLVAAISGVEPRCVC